MKRHFGNCLSNFIYWAWRLRRPFTDPGVRNVRSDAESLLPHWLQRRIRRVQHWAWGL